MSAVGFNLDLDVNVDEAITEGIRKLEFTLGREFLAWFLGVEVTQYLQKRSKQRFNQEGGLAGEKPWRPLSAYTVDERRSLGFGGAHPINHRTGDLEDWVTGSNSKVYGTNGLMNLDWPGNLPGGELGEKYETAQRGRKENASGKFVPARPVVRFSEVDFAHLMSRWALQVKDAGVKFGGN